MRQLLFRKNYYRGIAKLDDAKRLEAYDAIMAFAFTGEVTKVSPEVSPLLSMILDSIEADFETYERKVREYE